VKSLVSASGGRPGDTSSRFALLEMWELVLASFGLIKEHMGVEE
jgi:hypothetical protein